MSLFSIIVVNNAPGCNNSITQQVSTTGCTNYIVRITQNTNAVGPFSIYEGSVIPANLLFSGLTRQDMLNGVVVQLGPGCVSPTPTPTPTVTPSSVSPTPTPTPSLTPSLTPTNTPTPSVTGTPGATPTPTTTTTPTQSITPTLTTTPTLTPTPTATPTIFDIFIIDQDGNVLITQDGNPLILQDGPTGFFVSSGETSQPICINPQTLTQTIYAPTNNWDLVNRFYSDVSLTTPFNGNNYWYTNTTDSLSGYWQIGTDGFVIGYKWNPC